MKTKIAIYLAGSIKKGHEKNGETYWTDEDMDFLRKSLSSYELLFLNPAFRTDDLSDEHSIFGRDMLQVFSSDIVFADVRDRRGLGVGAEMMWAKVHKIPVITWAPKESHYRKSATSILGVPVNNFVHPFVAGLSDKIADNLTEAAAWIHTIISDPSLPIKGLDNIKSAIQYYKEQQLSQDEPMCKLMEACSRLQQRIKCVMR